MKRIHYAWVMVGGAAVVLAVQAMTFYSFGIFLRPITLQFEWDRGALSIAMSLMMIVSGVGSIFAGRLSDRYGPRILLTAAGVLVGAGFLLMSRISQLWQVYLLYGGLIAIGNAAIVVPITTTVMRWFVQKRGLALGLTWTGIGTGGVTAPILAQWIINASDWRLAFVVLGGLNIAVLVPLAQLMRGSPEQMGLKPYGADSPPRLNEMPKATTSITFRQALRLPQFWLVGAMLFCLVFIGQVMANHLAPHSADIGISPTIAATFVSVFAATSLLGRNLCGFITDRAGSRRTMLAGFILILAGMVWLVFARDVWALYAFSLWYGISFGIVVPLQSLMPGELFGLKSLGTITAALMFMGNIGGAISSPLAGAIFDAQLKYDLAFYLCIGAAAVGLALAVTLLLLTRPKVAHE